MRYSGQDCIDCKKFDEGFFNRGKLLTVSKTAFACSNLVIRSTKFMEQEIENPLRKSLGVNNKATWDSIQSNSHIDEGRDGILIWLLLDTLEEYKSLKKLLVKKRKTASNPEPEDPRFHLNPNGTLQSSPVVNQIKEVRRDLVKQLSELALSPVAAARLTIMSDSDKELIIEALKSDRNRGGE